jgi:hypothetical protein
VSTIDDTHDNTVDDAQRIAREHIARYECNTYYVPATGVGDGAEIAVEIDDSCEYAVPDATAGDNAAHLFTGRAVVLPRWQTRPSPAHDADWDVQATEHGRLVAAWGVTDHDLHRVVSTLIESARALHAREQRTAALRTELRDAADELAQAWRLDPGSDALRDAVRAAQQRLTRAINAAEPYLSSTELAAHQPPDLIWT